MVDKRVQRNSETDNSAYFHEANELSKRNSFSRREVGLSHPDTSSFIKLNDRGEIEIFAGEELGIIISPTTRSISLFADVVKFVTKEDYGLRWNNNSFNPASGSYHEPAIIGVPEKEINSGFNYSTYYLNAVDAIGLIEKEGMNVTTITGEYGFAPDENYEEIRNQPTSISAEQLNMLKNYSKTNSLDKVEYMKKLLESGFTFSQAKEKTERDKG